MTIQISEYLSGQIWEFLDQFISLKRFPTGVKAEWAIH